MKPYGAEDVGLLRREKNAGVPLRRALSAMLVFCLMSALFNGTSIRDTLSRKPFGPARRAWLTFADPLAAVSSRTRLDSLRRILEELFHP